jgi:hypothetical protein
MGYLTEIGDALRLFSAPTSIIDGIEQHSRRKMKVLYAGCAKHRDFIATKIFGSQIERISDTGRKPILFADREVANTSADVFVATGPTSQLLTIRRESDLCIPWWIDCTVSATEIINGPRSRGLQRDLGKVRKNDLRYEKADSEEDVRFFYDRIYTPTVLQSHGKEALPSSLASRLAQWASGKAELLKIYQNKDVIGGVMIDLRDEVPSLRDIGVLDGDRSLKNMGVVTAANFFGIEHLARQGYDEVGMGLSRCFLDNGVLQYKLKWRPVFREPSRGGFLIRIPALNEASRAFLNSLDCISMSSTGLVRARFEAFEDGTYIGHEKPGNPSVVHGVARSRWYDISGYQPQFVPNDAMVN